MNKAVIVSGEASETDSEDETPTEDQAPNIPSLIIPGAVISGEDTESENENDASISSAVSALGLGDTFNQEDIRRQSSDRPPSILHQKLRECNGRLYQNVESYWQNVVSETEKSLSSIDQQLIKSQLTLQSAVTSLKGLSANTSGLKTKLQSLLSAQFISNVNVAHDNK